MKRLNLLTLVVLAIVASCAKNEAHFQRQIASNWQQNFVRNFSENENLEVFVATNRNQKSASFECGENAFGAKSADALQLGVCKINVPKNHSTYENNFSKDARDSAASFYKILSAQKFAEVDLINQIKKSDRAPLIFVHGFNVKYDEAILRASQMAYDLKYQGQIILFTWPAGAKDGAVGMLNKTYDDNTQTARESVKFFRDFISHLNKNGITPNVMVHSMGHQVVLPALNQLALKNPQAKIVRQLVLNAPDFDAKIFAGIAANLVKTSSLVTLYCSYNDKAMDASEVVNKNNRLGACAAFDGVDTINVSLLKNANGGLGHSYYFSREVLTDVAQVLLGIPAQKRLFIKKAEANGAENYFLRD